MNNTKKDTLANRAKKRSKPVKTYFLNSLSTRHEEKEYKP
jgi:hypothetical protein